MVAGDAVGGVGGPGVRDQQAGDPALRAPHAAALAQVKHLQGGDLDIERYTRYHLHVTQLYNLN